MKRISLIVALVIVFSQAYAQEFLSKYENLSPKDLKSFVNDWYFWSCETHPDAAAKTAIDTVLCKAFEKLYPYSSRKQKYFVFPDRITIWYHKEPFKYLSQTTELLPLSPPPPPPPGVMCHDIYYSLDHKEFILPPYRTGKKALYLTKDIGQVLMDFIDKYDKSGNGRATRLLNRYFQTRRNRFRTVPDIIQIYVYPNAYVIPYVCNFWGGSMLYSLDYEYIRDIDSWIE